MAIRRKPSGGTRTDRTAATRNQAARASTTVCHRAKCADPERRARLEADDLAWLTYYLSAAFPKPFGAIHQEIARAFREAVENGNWCVVAAPRGSGKTTEVNGLALKAALTGMSRFIAVIPWKDADSQRALRFWRHALCNNFRLSADYPDLCAPFRACKQSSQRLAAMHWEGEADPTGAQMVLSDGLIVLPGSTAVLGSASLNGNPRGMQFALPDGSILRPTLLLIDDPSDKDTARSVERSRLNVAKIQEDVLGMAGPGEKLAAVMTGTRIAAYDTVSHYLGDEAPDWAKVSIPQITAWPNEQAMELWDEWNRLRIEGRERGMQDAIAYYHANRDRLLAGMSLSWAERFDAKRGEPDGFWSAMSDYYRMGRKAFLQERQNKPEEEAAGLYTILPDMVANRTGHHKRGEWPQDATIVTAGIDVGTATALNWCIVAATPALAVYVVEYGTYPDRSQPLWSEKSSETSQTAIHNGLSYLLRFIRTRWPAVKAVGIDANYATQTVYDVAKANRREGDFTVVPCRGVASTKFRLPQEANRHKLKALGEQCHGYRGDRGEEVWFNAHHWQRMLQEGFMAELGAPGSVQLYTGGRHDAMAQAVCADRLLSVTIRPDGREEHRWENDSRYPNHLADALKLAIVQANLEGASSNGQVTKARNRKPFRRAFRADR